MAEADHTSEHKTDQDALNELFGEFSDDKSASIQLPLPIQRLLDRVPDEGQNDADDEGEFCEWPQQDGSGQGEHQKTARLKRLRPSPNQRKTKSDRQLELVRRRQINYFKKKRDQKRMRMFYGRIRATFKFLFAILWVMLIMEAAQSPLWNFSTPAYSLENNRLLTKDQLRPYVLAMRDKPFYDVDTGYMTETLKEEYGIIDEVSVRRALFPMRLKVTVWEKRPWAEVYTDPKALKSRRHPVGLLTENDELIPLKSYEYSASLYPEGSLSPILALPNQPIDSQNLQALENVAYQLQHVSGLHFQHLDIRNPNLVTARFQETQVILGRMDEELSNRLARLSPLVPKIHELKTLIDAVDLRWPQQVVLRKKPNVQWPAPKQES